MRGRLEGKVAIITGTGGGQGRAAAMLFSREGATVIGCDLKADGAEETLKLVRAEGGQMTSRHPLDLADREAVAGWIDESVSAHRQIDILYNDASAPRFAPFAQLSVDEWHSTLRNELDVVFHATQLAWPHLAVSGGGVVVNVASIQGISALRGAPGGIAHATAKQGVIGFTRELALEGAAFGIRVNAISPGLILSPGTAALAEIPGAFDSFLDHQIIKRIGQPEDIARVALFLVSAESSFMTGANVVVDGGYTIT
jgi:NAD(P)-dependent dehydrogenase (short-subunit alcohol dehydrogenase family)